MSRKQIGGYCGQENELLIFLCLEVIDKVQDLTYFMIKNVTYVSIHLVLRRKIHVSIVKIGTDNRDKSSILVGIVRW